MQASNIIMIFVNIFVFHVFLVCFHLDFNTRAFRHCVIFSGKKVTRKAKIENDSITP